MADGCSGVIGQWRSTGHVGGRPTRPPYSLRGYHGAGETPALPGGARSRGLSRLTGGLGGRCLPDDLASVAANDVAGAAGWVEAGAEARLARGVPEAHNGLAIVGEADGQAHAAAGVVDDHVGGAALLDAEAHAQGALGVDDLEALGAQDGVGLLGRLGGLAGLGVLGGLAVGREDEDRDGEGDGGGDER